MNNIDKYPNKISILLKQGKSTIDQWKNEQELSLLINNCINIEKNLMKINNIEQSLKRFKDEMSSVIKFSPSKESELDDFISKLTSFGKIFKDNKDINGDDKNDNVNNIEQNIIDMKLKVLMKN